MIAYDYDYALWVSFLSALMLAPPLFFCFILSRSLALFFEGISILKFYSFCAIFDIGHILPEMEAASGKVLYLSFSEFQRPEEGTSQDGFNSRTIWKASHIHTNYNLSESIDR